MSIEIIFLNNCEALKNCALSNSEAYNGLDPYHVVLGSAGIGLIFTTSQLG